MAERSFGHVVDCCGFPAAKFFISPDGFNCQDYLAFFTEGCHYWLWRNAVEKMEMCVAWKSASLGGVRRLGVNHVIHSV